MLIFAIWQAKLAILYLNKKSNIVLYLLQGFVLAALLVVSALPARAQYDKDVFSFRGRTALADGKLQEAIASFNILAALDTTDYWTFFYRGIAKYNLGDIRGARRDFDTAVRLNPVFTSGYHYRAITESRFGLYDEALRDLEKAISLRPGYTGLYFSRGVTYFLSQKFDLAVKDFDKYIRKEPKDPSAYLNRGASYLFLGDTLKAVTDYNKAIKLDRFESEGYLRRGRVYAAQKKYPDALEDFSHAISLDTTNTFAYFNRAIIYFEQERLNEAMSDLNSVLRFEPGNALTLYNRSLVSARVGDYESALGDMSRVIAINPRNVLAYYNRAAFYVSMSRWDDALEDYDKAIELYPDFANAYLNRSYVKLKLGMMRSSREDYDTANRKVREYRSKVSSGAASFADTTKKYSALLTLDAEFAKKDFDDEILRHRDIDINLRPLYRFALTKDRDDVRYALSRRYENVLLDKFLAEMPLPVVVTNSSSGDELPPEEEIDKVLYGGDVSGGTRAFLLALKEISSKQFGVALSRYDEAAASEETGRYDALYKAFYYMNRGVLRADMIEFIASMENNVRTLTMDDKGNTRARVSDKTDITYDYSEAVADLEKAASIVGDSPYILFDLGNLRCLSSDLPEAISCYDRAVAAYPYFGDAFFNRGLVQIYLKDKDKGCIDLSRAGELGVKEAYGVISKYCDRKEEQ